ncbi:MAG: fibronectin type III domain-containing protein [Elainellaceae cyanobacterium]
MTQRSNGYLVFAALGLLLSLAYSSWIIDLVKPQVTFELLSDPFLQRPTASTVNVVWFTEFVGDRHTVEYGDGFGRQQGAVTTKLSRIKADPPSPEAHGDSTSEAPNPGSPMDRDIWRHEATVPNLQPGQRVSYRVVSVRGNRRIESDSFQLASQPPPGAALKVLLTSDHQQKPMTPANLQKVVETVGRVDAVFMAGDLVNVPDRGAEWFDGGGAFFPALQGRAQGELTYNDVSTWYQGGAIIQSAPLFPAVGNHEVMGRVSELPLDDQFNDPIPRAIAAQRYDEQASEINPTGDPIMRDDWLKAQSFNIDTYQELFTLPESDSGGSKYYATTFGDVRLVSLYITNIWRTPKLDPDARGRYRERDEDLADPTQWGYGQHIFEAIGPASPQYGWLQQELASPEWQQARYRVVMFHHPPHSLGDNIVPAYTDPVQIIDYLPDGAVQSVRYEYPQSADYLTQHVLPLVESAGAQLVFYGHDHIWNRFVSDSGMHFLETSNVGNTYGAAWRGNRRQIPIGFTETYMPLGDPNGLDPVVPTIAPLLASNGEPQPFIASNEITVFSILDTEQGTVSSYRFDTREPNSAVVKFDEFTLRGYLKSRKSSALPPSIPLRPTDALRER